MIYRASSGDDLVLDGTPFPKFPHALDRGIHDVHVGFPRERYATTEPRLLPQFEHLLKRMPTLRALVLEMDFSRLDSPRCKVANVSFSDRGRDGKPVNPTPFDLLSIRTKGSGGEACDAGSRKMVKNALPTGGNIVVAFVHENEIEIIGSEAPKPF